MSRLILASTSPRRRELLAALGLDFDVRAPGIDEATAEQDPVRVAEGLALRKARAVLEEAGEAVVLGSDTVVVLDGRLLGKPASPAEARAMLESLRGREHEVVTGVAVVARSRSGADHARTTVFMRPYTDGEIDAYVASGAPMDKAGAYAIQDETLRPVERLDGCECAVIGLPLWTARRLLRVVGGIPASPPPFDRCAACPLREAETAGTPD